MNDPTDQDLWGGYLNSNLSAQDTQLKAVSDSVATAGRLPIGSLYMNADDGTNPASLLGYGTWVAFGAGRVPIGVGMGTDGLGQTLTVAAGDTGGEYKHPLIEAENGPHTHGPGGGSTYFLMGATGATQTTTIDHSTADLEGKTTATASSGLGTAHENKQPYIAVYIWKRSA